jgi:predicted dehydrogenase
MRESKVRIAVIGCGGISRGHVAAYKAMKESCELVYCVDIDEAKARATAEAVGAKWHTDYLQVLDAVDAVDICTPPHLHAEMSIKAMLKGKHVLTEKVMATTLEDADEMIRVADEKRVKLMVAYVTRYITSGEYGQPYMAAVRTEDYMQDPALWRKSWKSFPMGCLLSHGCHYVDQMIWNLGDVAQAAAFSSDHFQWDKLGREDTAVSIYRFTSGALGNYIASWGTRHTDCRLRFAVYLEGGHLILSYDPDGIRRITMWQQGEKEGRVMMEQDPRRADQMDAYSAAKNFAGECAHFIDCIVNDKEPLTNGRESKKSMEAIIAAYHAEDNNLIATLPLENVRPQFIWRKLEGGYPPTSVARWVR